MRLVKLTDAAEETFIYLAVDKMVSIEPTVRDSERGNTQIRMLCGNYYSVVEPVDKVIKALSSPI